MPTVLNKVSKDPRRPEAAEIDEPGEVVLCYSGDFTRRFGWQDSIPGYDFPISTVLLFLGLSGFKHRSCS